MLLIAISKSVNVLLRLDAPLPFIPLLLLLYTLGWEVRVGWIGSVVDVKTMDETGFHSPTVLTSWKAWRYFVEVPFKLVVIILELLTLLMGIW